MKQNSIENEMKELYISIESFIRSRFKLTYAHAKRLNEPTTKNWILLF